MKKGFETICYDFFFPFKKVFQFALCLNVAIQLINTIQSINCLTVYIVLLYFQTVDIKESDKFVYYISLPNWLPSNYNPFNKNPVWRP